MKLRTLQLLILGLVNFAGNSGYSLMVPLYPPLAKNKGLSDELIGYIFCIYPVGSFLVTLILGKSMTNQNKKRAMEIGLLLSILGMIGFSLIENVINKAYFITYSAILRLITGIGATFCFTPSYSLASYLFYDNIGQILSIMEIISGIALFSGPLIGGVFYLIGQKTFIGGYAMPFYFISLLYFLILILIILKLNVEREEINNNNEVEISIHSDENKPALSKKVHHSKSITLEFIEKLSYFQISQIPAIIITYSCFTAPQLATMAIRTFLAEYLQTTYNLDESTSTLFFLIQTLFYGLSAGYIGFQKNINRKIPLFLGLILCPISCFLYGPDTNLIKIPKNIYIVCLADALNGISLGLMAAIIVPEFIAIMSEKYQDMENDINDLSSALFISAWSLGEFLGPLIGGILQQNYQFSRASSIIGFLMIIPIVIYGIFLVQIGRKQKKIQQLLG